MRAFELLLGLSLDLALGDPGGYLHPVRLAGMSMERLEGLWRRLLPGEDLLAGLLFAASALALLVGPVVVLQLGLEGLASSLISGMLLFFCLGARTLHDEVEGVLKLLEGGDLEGARKALSFLVSRETGGMSRERVCAALVETLSENSVDAFFAPLLYGAVGGGALAWLHRVVNTADAMVGYRTPRYLLFGRASARLDDLLNFVPARLFALAFWALEASRAGVPLRAILEEGRKSESPNAGIPMAAFALRLGVRLGGPAVYFGALKEKPVINPEGREPGPEDVREALALYRRTWAWASALAISALLLL